MASPAGVRHVPAVDAQRNSTRLLPRGRRPSPSPKLVFFFDEAHLLFDDMPKELTGQDRAGGEAHPLQGRRASTSSASRPPTFPTRCSPSFPTASSTGCAPTRPPSRRRCARPPTAFRENPAFDSAEALLELGTGEALVSLLNEEGQPQRGGTGARCCRRSAAWPLPIAATLEAIWRGPGASDGEVRRRPIDRESAYEKLAAEKSRRCRGRRAGCRARPAGKGARRLREAEGRRGRSGRESCGQGRRACCQGCRKRG